MGGGARTAAAREARPVDRRVHRGRRILAIAALVVLAIAVAVAGAAVDRGRHALEAVEHLDDDVLPASSVRPEPVEDGAVAAPITMLLIGTDSRADAGGADSLLTDLGSRADTILVVHVPGDRHSVQIMSIMRDTWVDVPGVGEAKIGGALSAGGVPLLVQVVETLVAQRVDDVAIVDLAGFAGLTEALGGVTVENEVAFTTTGGQHVFPAGPVELEGEAALAYVRERSAFVDGDYQRVRNQQALVHALLERLLAPEVLADPTRIASLLEATAPFVATTDGVTSTALVELAATFTGTGVPTVQTFTMPTDGTAMIGDQSVVLVDAAGLAIVQEAFAAESMDDFVPPGDR